MSLAVFLSRSPDETAATADLSNSSGALLWRLDGLRYGDWTAGPQGDGTFSHATTIATPAEMRTDGGGMLQDAPGLYLHMHLFRPGCRLWPDFAASEQQNASSVSAAADEFDPHCAIHAVARLDRLLPAPRAATGRRLLGSSETAGEDERDGATKATSAPLVAWWHENVTVSLLTDNVAHVPTSLPNVTRSQLAFDDAARVYKPHLGLSTFWDRQEHMYPINASTPTLPLQLEYRPLSLLRWQLYLQMDEQWRTQREWGAQSAADHDEFKRMLLETNPYFLGVTMVISLLHTVLDIFAFKNGAWKGRKGLGTWRDSD